MKKNIQIKAIRRLNIIEGQIRGLKKMIEEEKYCVDFINQSLAIKQAISSLENLILENHLDTCVRKSMKSKNNKKTIEEIIELFDKK